MPTKIQWTGEIWNPQTELQYQIMLLTFGTGPSA